MENKNEIKTSEELSKEQESLKDLGLASEKRQETAKIDKDSLTLLVLVILVVISGFQTYKLSALAEKGLKAGTPAQNSSSGTALPDSLENLSQQVGGC